jgi:hypothetical protein
VSLRRGSISIKFPLHINIFLVISIMVSDQYNATSWSPYSNSSMLSKLSMVSNGIGVVLSIQQMADANDRTLLGEGN